MSKNEKESVAALIAEDDRRKAHIRATFDPLTGEGSLGPRREICVKGLSPDRQWIPEEMTHIPFVSELVEAGSMESFIVRNFGAEEALNPALPDVVREQWIRYRCRYDFPFWAALMVYIKNKNTDGDPQILFRLTYPQRKFVSKLEELRLARRPIRLALLKARQWGGSTTSQLYMAWLQLTQRQGLNSLIIAHQGAGSDEIKDMFDRMIKEYPLEMLIRPGDECKDNEKKMEGVGRSGSIFRIPRRNCKVKIGTAERPDSCRGGDYALVHLSEVGIWKETEGKSPEDIVRSACTGVLYKPLTMIVYESTANGHGNFFHREYLAARDNPKAQFQALFIPWYDIDWNVLPFESEEERRTFAGSLLKGKDNPEAPSDREEPGRYLWWLWKRGATLEGINWYIAERGKHSSHGSMAAECPSDDIEAFVNSGASVFDKYQVEEFRTACTPPRSVGEIVGAFYPDGTKVNPARIAPDFKPDAQGNLYVWSHPDGLPVGHPDRIRDRYIVAVDIGGRSDKADWSVIVVFDRLPMMDGEPPEVVAQWRGHCDIDLLAWKAADVASYYENALLVIESNTLETHDRERQIEGGDQSAYILNQIGDVYPNLYARAQPPEEIKNKVPLKYGFHTNTATKPMVISGLIKYVREHAWVERDERCLSELLDYERKPNGAYGAIPGSHDDILMTRAIGLHVCFNEMDLPAEGTSAAEMNKKLNPKKAPAPGLLF